ncbi:MAG: glycosyltransferase [Chloroflexi bacterium]|nr:glycosyltransferase [Chloroflexota bacterium]
MTNRILYWTSRFWPHIGGVEVLGLHLIPVLQSQGMQVQVVTSHSGLDLPDEAEINGIPIRRFHFLTSLTHRDLGQMAQARRELASLKHSFQPDLVHLHFSGPESLFHWQTQSAHPAPTLMTIHAIPNELQAQKFSARTNTAPIDLDHNRLHGNAGKAPPACDRDRETLIGHLQWCCFAR